MGLSGVTRSSLVRIVELPQRLIQFRSAGIIVRNKVYLRGTKLGILT